MTVSSDELLKNLPPFTNNSVLIENNQEIHDIIKEVLNAHKYFAGDYDFIYQYFDGGTIEDICNNIFSFLKKNLRYEIEKEEKQTTKSPAALLALRTGDCKHYAGFSGGVLSAIVRNTGRKINWQYRFASYSIWNENVEHVFTVVYDRGKEIWIDPVLNYLNSREVVPTKIINKKVNDVKMLNRISGTLGNALFADLTTGADLINSPVQYDSTYLIANAQTSNVLLPAETLQPDFYPEDVPPNVLEAIKMLLFYGIIDENLNIYNDRYLTTLEGLQGQDATDLSNNYGLFMAAAQTPAIGNIFSSIWGTVKQVSLAIPRGAYLSLVSLNVFNLAGHLWKCIANPDGSTDQNGIDQLWGVWHKKLSGDTNILLRAIRNGHTKKAILGIEQKISGPEIPAWVAAASVIIAAMTPIITAVLKGKNSFDSMTASQLAMQPTSLNMGVSSTSTTMQKYLPYLLLAGVVYYVYSDKKK